MEENGNALKYVKNQTEAICLAAVENNSSALRFVKNQTEALHYDLSKIKQKLSV